jgi:YfiH family protein
VTPGAGDPLVLADGLVWTSEDWGRALRSSPLSGTADHFFTTRQLRLRGSNESEEWARVAATIGVPPERLVHLEQVHGRRVVTIRRGEPRQAGGGRPRADILVSDDPSVALVVQVADCVPLLMADSRTGAVAAVHAGWRGTLAGAAPAAVAALAEEFGARPEDLLVALGPSIGPCCYTVGADVIAAFRSSGFREVLGRWFTQDGDGKARLDLWTANEDQLTAAGVRAGRITTSRLCTSSHPAVFHSYRRDGRGTGRLAAVIRSRGVPPRPSPRSPGDRPRH